MGRKEHHADPLARVGGRPRLADTGDGEPAEREDFDEWFERADDDNARNNDTGHDPVDEDPEWGTAALPPWLATPSGQRLWAQRPSARADDDGPADLDDIEWDDEDAPGGRRRLAIAPPAAIGLVIVGVLACAFAMYSLLGGSADEAAPTVAFDASAGPSSSAVQARAEAKVVADELVVSVVGLVRRPGLVRLAGGARVADAIERAGGARTGADLLSLNLAQPLRDGDQILVGYTSAGKGLRSAVVGTANAGGDSGGASPSGGARAPASGAGGTVNLNTATAAELDELPGVGPVTAEAILAWRKAHGEFTSVDQLAEVDGIGPTRLEKLRPRVSVS